MEKSTRRGNRTTLAHEAAFMSWLLVIKKMNGVADISLDFLCEQSLGRDPPGSSPPLLQSNLQRQPTTQQQQENKLDPGV